MVFPALITPPPVPPQVELKSGEMYRGELHEAEDNWNVQLSNVTATGRDGKQTHVEHIFIRGSRVRFVIVPDMLKNAPMFKRIDPKNKMKNVALGELPKARRCPRRSRRCSRPAPPAPALLSAAACQQGPRCAHPCHDALLTLCCCRATLQAWAAAAGARHPAGEAAASRRAAGRLGRS